MEETGIKNPDLISLGNPFKAITTNGNIYTFKTYAIKVGNKSDVTNLTPEKGKHVWIKYQEAQSQAEWVQSQLVLEQAKN